MMRRILIIIIGLLIIQQTLAQIAESENDICPILIGSETPSASIQTLEGDTIDIKNITDLKPTVLIIYRGGWCPYCQKHLSALEETKDSILNKGYQIVAISPDHYSTIPKTIHKEELSYSLYSDNQLNAAQAYGVAYKLSEKDTKKYNNVFLQADEWQNSDQHLLPVPAVFIIKDGIITFSYVNPNYKTRLSAKTIISLLE